MKDATVAMTTEVRQISDEASALEHIGLAPLLIEGRADNIKVTRPEDLALAELFLSAPSSDE